MDITLLTYDLRHGFSKYLVNQRIYVMGEVLISDVGPRYP